MGFSSKWSSLFLLILAGLASADYVRGNFFFASGAAVTGIGAIIWVDPTPPNLNSTNVNWIFGNITYTGTAPDYQTMVLDFKNTSITCDVVNGICYKNNTALKKGWHSIQVYLNNSGGGNSSEIRLIYVNVSEQNTPIIILGDPVIAKNDSVYYIGGGLMLIVGAFMLYYRRKKPKMEYTIEDYDNENAYSSEV